MSAENKFSQGSQLSSETHLSSDLIGNSGNDIDISEMKIKIEVKEEVCLLEETSVETGMTHDSNAHIKNESASFASVYLTEPGTNTHKDYHQMVFKTEIKEEPGCSETSTEPISTSRDVHLKEEHFDTQDNGSDGEFILPESTRLDSETEWNIESSTDLEMDCLKPTENSSASHEDVNTNSSHGSDTTSHVTHDNQRIYKCKLCDKSFRQASYLKTHNLIHKGKRPFKCEKCDKTFLMPSRLKVHNLTHESERPFKCESCEKSFTTIYHLKRHNLTHEGKTPFKCNQCNKSFTTASNLKIHNVIHEGKRPFKCDKCDKSFGKASVLKTHKLIHEDEKPFKCEKCDRGFVTSSTFKIHCLIHEGIKPHKCEICQKSFTRATNLKAHSWTHVNKTPSMVTYVAFKL